MRSIRRLASTLLAASLAGGCVSNQPRTDSTGQALGWSGHTVREVPGYCGPHGERLPLMANNAYPPTPSMAGAHANPSAASSQSASQKPKTSNNVALIDFRTKTSTPQTTAQTPQPVRSQQQGTIQQVAAYGAPNQPGPIMPALHRQGGAPGYPAPGAGAEMTSMGALPRFPAQRTQVRFASPSGMKVAWFTQGADGRPAYSSSPVDAPGRYNFPQGAIYRLKLSNIEGRPGMEVYPTMEVVPTNPKTESFLAHSAVPVEFTPDDFKQISQGTYVVKVIYLPDPQFQDAAITGTEEILSTRLEPGVDPIQEALRRGSILLIVRMGNIDQEAPNTPPLNQSVPGGAAANPMLNFGPQGGAPGQMVPFGPPGGGPGAPMAPPASMIGPGGLPSFTGAPATNAPGGLPPQFSSMPMPPKTGPAMPPSAVPAMPVSRPGTATVTSPLPPAPLPPGPIPPAPLPPAPNGPLPTLR